MRATKPISTLIATLLFASSAHAGLILTLAEVEFGDPNVEIGVYVQITDGESLGFIAFDVTFGGVGVTADEIMLGPVPGNTANCPSIDPPGPPTAPDCYLSPYGLANPDGTRYALSTVQVVGVTGGTYLIGYQTILDGTWDGTASLANVLATNDEAHGHAPITDITIVPLVVPEPTTAALLGLGLLGIGVIRQRVG